jgi:hypothetical protein
MSLNLGPKTHEEMARSTCHTRFGRAAIGNLQMGPNVILHMTNALPYLVISVLAAAIPAACSSVTPRQTAPTTALSATTLSMATPSIAESTLQHTGEPCHDGQLRLAFVTTTAAAGTVEAIFSFTDRSATSCRLMGYPGFAALSPAGTPLAIKVVHGVDPATGATNAVSVVALHPGQHADFVVQYEEVGNPCPTVGQLLIGSPSSTSLHLVDPKFPNLASFDACGQSLTVAISPIQPASWPPSVVDVPYL